MAEESDNKPSNGDAATNSKNTKLTDDVLTDPRKLFRASIEEIDSAGPISPVSNLADAEGHIKKLPYPKSTLIITSDEFFKSISIHGTRSILVLYISHHLGFAANDATIIYHVFAILGFLLCILGAIVSDSWLGKFKTVFYFTLINVIGTVLVLLGATPPLNVPVILFTLLGLVLIGMGAGGAQPCLIAFGGDQFQIPEQERQRTTYFSVLYFAINAAALITYIVSPILRDEVDCFGEKECYFAPFGLHFLAIFISTVIFVLGRPLYKIEPPAGNMIVMVSKAIGNAIATKWKEKKTNPREHWLDYADKKYDRQLIADIKVLMRILVLYLPLPIFWALFDQQGSRWVIQATKMNGDMGAWDIKPDQMQMLNPLLVLTLIPLYEIAFYPLLNLFGIRRPLQKLTLGGITAGIAFIISGLVALKVEKTYPVLPSAGNAQLRLYNGELCGYSITTNLTGFNFGINSLDMYVNKNIDVDPAHGLNVQFHFTANSGVNCATLPSQNCLLKEGKAYYVFLNSKNSTHRVICGEDTIAKSSRGYPLGRTLANVNPRQTIQWKNSKGSIEHTEQAYERNLIELKADTYQVMIDNVKVETAKLEVGGIYTVIIAEEPTGEYRSNVLVVTDPNSVSILLLIPQYFVMAIAEVMFSVTGFEFSYAQAPMPMKTVLQACWLITMALGNMIVVIVAELSLFDSQASEFFLFAGLMFVDMIVFAFVAYGYVPNDPTATSESEILSSVDNTKSNGVNMKEIDE